jgi:monoamine oxidase
MDGASRRDFLKSLAAGAAAAAFGSIPSGLSARGNPRIAIVGAGISGLTAALTLMDHHVDATVYEASGRIGGRMFSDTRGYWSARQVTEWCGELIDTGHETIIALADRFHLPLDDLHAAERPGSRDTFFFNGHYYAATDADFDFVKIFQKLQHDYNDAGSLTWDPSTHTKKNVALDNMSVRDWIESRVPGGLRSRLGELLDVAYTIEYGAATTDQSALNIVFLLGAQPDPFDYQLHEFGVSDETFHIRGGNQQLPLAIAERLNAGRQQRVQLGWRLTAVETRADGTVRLRFATAQGSKTVDADVALLTLPFAVLRTLDYSRAGFDQRKIDAIQNLGAARNAKLHLQFDERLWRDNGPWGPGSTGGTYADTGYQSGWEVTRAQAGIPGILVDYLGGVSAVAGLNASDPYTTIGSSPQVAQNAVRFLQQIEPVFPGITGEWNQKATLSIPPLDPNLNLSYSYWRVGQYQRIAGYEAVPQGNIYFGGEHTSYDFQGFMEGGASEGVRAASEILTAFV